MKEKQFEEQYKKARMIKARWSYKVLNHFVIKDYMLVLGELRTRERKVTAYGGSSTKEGNLAAFRKAANESLLNARTIIKRPV